MSASRSDRAQLLALKRKQAKLLREKKAVEKYLPHKFMPMYSWQRELIDSENRINLLTAANQIGKSTGLIRRMILNSTEPSRWKKLWGLDKYPRQFWYFYPDSLTCEKEVDTKWVPDWLPLGPMERDRQYGWRLEKKSGRYHALHFNAGPTVYFQFYTKSVSSVQAGSVYEAYIDEELPIAFYDEVMFRLTATNGIFTSGFTPTLNQKFWKDVMADNSEILPSALKMSVSMYDCLKFEDGSPSSVMTEEKIELAEARCKSETERQRRIFGKFVQESGRTFFAYESLRSLVSPYSVKEWTIYAGVDYGSGYDTEGQPTKRSRNHPAAIVFVAVRHDFRKGAVFRSWRGDGEKTTAGDVFNKYMMLSARLGVTQACYDPGAPDFGTIAARNGVNFSKADKSRDAGEDLLNTLFGNGMLDIFDNDEENLKLSNELETVMVANQKVSSSKKGDDLCDALRYCVMQIPWDLSAVADKEFEPNQKLLDNLAEAGARLSTEMSEEEAIALQIRQRRGEDIYKKEESSWGEMEDEFAFWNEEYG